MTFVLGLLPLIVAFAVSVPVSVYPLAIGRPGATVILFVFGSLVSFSDIFLRPAIIHWSRAPDVAVIAVGIVEGFVPFGTIGLVIGPVVLGGAKDVLEIYAQGRVAPTTDWLRPSRATGDGG